MNSTWRNAQVACRIFLKDCDRDRQVSGVTNGECDTIMVRVYAAWFNVNLWRCAWLSVHNCRQYKMGFTSGLDDKLLARHVDHRAKRLLAIPRQFDKMNGFEWTNGIIFDQVSFHDDSSSKGYACRRSSEHIELSSSDGPKKRIAPVLSNVQRLRELTRSR